MSDDTQVIEMQRKVENDTLVVEAVMKALRDETSDLTLQAVSLELFLQADPRVRGAFCRDAIRRRVPHEGRVS